MVISGKKIIDDTLEVSLKGHLDIATAPILEEELTKEIDKVNNVRFDFKELEYISSAGLRVLMLTSTRLKGRGNVNIINVGEDVYDILELTGLTGILKVEK